MNKATKKMSKLGLKNKTSKASGAKKAAPAPAPVVKKKKKVVVEVVEEEEEEEEVEGDEPSNEDDLFALAGD